MYKLQNIYGYNAAVPELFGFGQTTHTILERLHQKYKDRIPTEKEIFDIKHEMLTMQSELDKANEQIKKLAEERQAAKDQVIRLETELGRNKHR